MGRGSDARIFHWPSEGRTTVTAVAARTAASPVTEEHAKGGRASARPPGKGREGGSGARAEIPREGGEEVVWTVEKLPVEV